MCIRDRVHVGQGLQPALDVEDIDAGFGRFQRQVGGQGDAGEVAAPLEGLSLIHI